MLRHDLFIGQATGGTSWMMMPGWHLCERGHSEAVTAF